MDSMNSFSQGALCLSYLPRSIPLLTPFSSHLLLLIYPCYNRLLLCLTGSLLAYNTTSHTDQSSRLSVKEGESVLSCIFFSPRNGTVPCC